MRRSTRVEEVVVAGLAVGMLGLALIFAAVLTLNQTPRPITPTGTLIASSEPSATEGATVAETPASTIPNLNGSAAITLTSATVTNTLTAAATSTATSTVSPTATPSASPTPSPTASPTASATASPMPTQVFTYTPLPTHTPYPTYTPLPTFTPSATPSQIPTATLTNTSTATPTSTPSNTATPTDTATSTNTFTPSPTPCFLRAGYVPYYVQPGDTLYGIALRVGLSLSSLQAANCLTTTTIYVGQLILVPPGSIRPPTWTPIPVTPSPTRRK